jgi:hypothetical protein
MDCRPCPLIEVTPEMEPAHETGSHVPLLVQLAGGVTFVLLTDAAKAEPL